MKSLLNLSFLFSPCAMKCAAGEDVCVSRVRILATALWLPRGKNSTFQRGAKENTLHSPELDMSGKSSHILESPGIYCIC